MRDRAGAPAAHGWRPVASVRELSYGVALEDGPISLAGTTPDRPTTRSTPREGANGLRSTPSNPFARKPIATLLAEMEEGERLHRVLGPLALTSLGVGATIGTGIYVLTGEVAHNFAGPSLMLSFVLAAIGCGFAALCYSELASMVPVAGSAYTYAYATLGELIAWIIGWDLVLEYAIGSAAVANGWSNYFVDLAHNLIGLRMDPRLLSPPWDFVHGHFVTKT